MCELYNWFGTFKLSEKMKLGSAFIHLELLTLLYSMRLWHGFLSSGPQLTVSFCHSMHVNSLCNIFKSINGIFKAKLIISKIDVIYISFFKINIGPYSYLKPFLSFYSVLWWVAWGPVLYASRCWTRCGHDTQDHGAKVSTRILLLSCK